MLLNFIPIEILQSLALVAVSMLVHNMLGSYKSKQWMSFDKKKAVRGVYDSLMVVGSLFIVCFAIVYLVPERLVNPDITVDALFIVVGGFGMAWLGKVVIQLKDILTFKEEEHENISQSK